MDRHLLSKDISRTKHNPNSPTNKKKYSSRIDGVSRNRSSGLQDMEQDNQPQNETLVALI